MFLVFLRILPKDPPHLNAEHNVYISVLAIRPWVKVPERKVDPNPVLLPLP